MTPASNGLMHDGLAYWARRAPDKAAVVLDGDKALTYGELARWSDGVAERLQALGAGPGEVVALAAANSLTWVAAAFGILKAGATIAPFNDRLLEDELAYLADFSQAALVLADPERAALLHKGGVTAPRLDLGELERFRGGASAGWRETRVGSDDPAMIIFTSGSTARPKGAVMGHGNYLAKFMEMRLLDGWLGPETRSLMPFGLHASPGLAWGILFTSILGGTLYVVTRYEAEQTLHILADQRITFFIGVPMIYDQVSRLPQFQEADLLALTFARVGGAPASLETLARWREAGVVVRGLYGMTEVGGGAIIADEAEALARPHACGRGLAFSRFRIVRDDGAACAPGEPGHILLQGPGLMLRYWRDPEATAAALAGGWMHTGDVGMVDEEGYFTFVDRAKEMIKSSGFNVSPAEIEAVIASHEAVGEVAVFAVKDSKAAESACACVYPSRSVEAREIYDHCATRLAAFKVPRYVVMMDRPLPRLANQKVDRRGLKALYADPANLPERMHPSREAAPVR